MFRIGPRLPVVVAIVALAACTVERTTDDGGTPPPGDASVEVQLAEFSIELPDSVAAGTVSFNITNNGEMEHSFAIEGAGFEDELTDALAPGGTFTYTAELAPGTYTVWCPIGNHRGEGMEATIEVTEGAASSGAPLFEEGVDPSEQEAPITDDYSAP